MHSDRGSLSAHPGMPFRGSGARAFGNASLRAGARGKSHNRNGESERLEDRTDAQVNLLKLPGDKIGYLPPSRCLSSSCGMTARATSLRTRAPSFGFKVAVEPVQTMRASSPVLQSMISLRDTLLVSV